MKKKGFLLALILTITLMIIIYCDETSTSTGTASQSLAIAITSPTEGSCEDTGDFVISGTLQYGCSISTVEINIDDTGYTGISNLDAENYGWAHNVSLSDCEHSVVVRVVDYCGSSPASTTTNIMVDNTPPTISVSPINMGCTIYIRGTAYDCAFDQDMVIWEIINSHSNVVASGTASVDNVSGTWDGGQYGVTPSFNDDPYTITVTAYDTCGHIASDFSSGNTYCSK